MEMFRKGMTFVEMIVAIGIFSMVMLGLATFFSTLWRSHSQTYQTGIASFTASRSVEGVINNIRNARQADNGAFTIEAVAENDLTIFSNIDSDDDTERLRYFLDNGQLKMRITNPSGSSYPTDYDSEQTVASGVVNDDESIFAYYNINNEELTAPITLGDIKMIKVFILIDNESLRTPLPIAVESYASIRNLSEYDRIESN